MSICVIHSQVHPDRAESRSRLRTYVNAMRGIETSLCNINHRISAEFSQQCRDMLWPGLPHQKLLTFKDLRSGL